MSSDRSYWHPERGSVTTALPTVSDALVDATLPPPLESYSALSHLHPRVNLPASASPAMSSSTEPHAAGSTSASGSGTIRRSRHHVATLQPRTSFTPDRTSSTSRRLAGFQTPPIAATSSNRVPVIARQRSATLSGSRSALGERVTTYSKPFPIPSYLKHSNYAERFFTTPEAEGLFKPDGEHAAHDGMDLDLDGHAQRKLSEGLGIGNGEMPSVGGAHPDQLLLPTCWDYEDRCALIEVSSDALGVSFNGSGKYGDRDAAAVRANRPIPHQAGVYYFEVSITDKGKQGYIGIGVSHQTVSLSRLPGWETNSWGYHGDDGFSFSCQGTGKTYGPTFGTGDVIGCGIDWTGVVKSDKERSGEKEKDGARCFFTKNGEFLGYAFSGLHGKLYPSVGLRTPGEVVRANFGAEPFRFDIDSLVRERKRSILSSIASTPVSSNLLLPSQLPAIPRLLPPQPSEEQAETIQQLIQSYLVHHGYTASAQSFASQIREERTERAEGLVAGSSTLSSSSVSVAGNGGGDPSILLEGGQDSVARLEIRAAFLRGQIDQVIELTRQHYPAVLEETSDGMDDGGMLFKLRMRAFIEAVGRSGRSDEDEAATLPRKGKGKAVTSPNPPWEEEDDVAMREEDEERYTTPPLSPCAPSETSPALASPIDDLLVLGQSLYSQYGSNSRPAVQEALATTFSLMAYERPEERGGKVAWLLSREAREKLADELNSAILVSQGLPPMAQLESMFRQTSATIRLLGDVGYGGAAFPPYPFLGSTSPTM